MPQTVDCLRDAAGCCVTSVREDIEKHCWSRELDDLKFDLI